jgi:hypothetical protein
MTTPLSTKLTALGLALIVNCIMIGGVAYLFGVHTHEAAVQVLAQTSALTTPAAV